MYNNCLDDLKILCIAILTRLIHIYPQREVHESIISLLFLDILVICLQEVFLILKRNWVFATNSDFLIPIYLQPNVVDLRYFKLWIMLDVMIIGIRKFGFVAKTQFLLPFILQETLIINMFILKLLKNPHKTQNFCIVHCTLYTCTPYNVYYNGHSMLWFPVILCLETGNWKLEKHGFFWRR